MKSAVTTFKRRVSLPHFRSSSSSTGPFRRNWATTYVRSRVSWVVFKLPPSSSFPLPLSFYFRFLKGEEEERRPVWLCHRSKFISHPSSSTSHDPILCTTAIPMLRSIRQSLTGGSELMAVPKNKDVLKKKTFSKRLEIAETVASEI